MTLAECKKWMRLFRESSVDFNWRTTARWALRQKWAIEERDDAIARAKRAEAVVSAIPWQSLLNIYESAILSDRDEDALGAFLGACIPVSVFNSESEE